jgi:hypothetical protein
MTDTPHDTPPDDPSSSLDEPAAEATVKGESQDQAEEARTSESEKPWWKFWG